MKKEPQYVYCGINGQSYIVMAAICFLIHIIYIFYMPFEPPIRTAPWAQKKPVSVNTGGRQRLR